MKQLKEKLNDWNKRYQYIEEYGGKIKKMKLVQYAPKW